MEFEVIDTPPRYEEPKVDIVGKLLVSHNGDDMEFLGCSFSIDKNGVLLIWRAYPSIQKSEKPVMGLIAAFSDSYRVVVDGESK